MSHRAPQIPQGGAGYLHSSEEGGLCPGSAQLSLLLQALVGEALEWRKLNSVGWD